ncbi:hypothetical protein CAP31_01335 [Sulfuriferula sp. AH1]|uniref:tetratricopeptide repeat protein n=1 Tax=Sulfuriferula sp. AH1 TaxID=1985873 RepID=UPI000B3B3A10|nr:tetratricopeptide repeat protein [Sulfuriferula sp. AH1]ARU30454.1 hypothetical protein CAP31_01335 [Sulfuriferula sp. AH1]
MYTAFRLFIALLLAGNLAYADNLPTVHQIYQTAESGKLDDAHRMIEQVLQAHPESAKAHFINAEILAKQGALANAKNELDTAERLAPGLPFAKPQSVASLKQRIAASSPVQAANNGTLQSGQSVGQTFPWMMLLIGIGAAISIVWILKSIFSRNAGNASSSGMYGAGPVQNYPNGGIPANPAGYGGAPYPAQTGSGIGGNIVSGLATGAAVGAGIVAGEALMHHFTNGSNSTNNNGIINNPPVEDDNTQPQYDMGGSDFGLTDSSSWDDGSSDDSGSDGW